MLRSVTHHVDLFKAVFTWHLFILLPYHHGVLKALAQCLSKRWFLFFKASFVASFGTLFPIALRFLPRVFLFPSVFSRNGEQGCSGSSTQSFVELGGGSCILCAGGISSIPGRPAAWEMENEKLFKCSSFLRTFYILLGQGIEKSLVSSLLLEKWLLLDISLYPSSFPTQ